MRKTLLLLSSFLLITGCQLENGSRTHQEFAKRCVEVGGAYALFHTGGTFRCYDGQKQIVLEISFDQILGEMRLREMTGK